MLIIHVILTPKIVVRNPLIHIMRRININSSLKNMSRGIGNIKMSNQRLIRHRHETLTTPLAWLVGKLTI